MFAGCFLAVETINFGLGPESNRVCTIESHVVGYGYVAAYSHSPMLREGHSSYQANSYRAAFFGRSCGREIM